MSFRAWMRATAALAVLSGSLGVSGCGREVLPIETGGGGAGGTVTTGGGGTGGTGGVTCTPTLETCNKLDDDCDGQVDEGCDCNDGEAQNCYSGPPETLGIGLCTLGKQACSNGQWGPCQGEVLPAPEGCDQLDNDCNGLIDDGNPGGGAMCTLGLAGACAVGIEKCVGGKFVCSQAVFPSPEACDGIDNDCDGAVDDGNPGGGGACTTGQPGPCGMGTLTCSGGAVACVPVAGPSPEVCDGVDNDCDGIADDGNPGGGGACDTGQSGQCAAGVLGCSAGALLCFQSQGPQNEVCDGVDNDCDGQVDDNILGVGNPCNTGAPPPCNQGTTACQAGGIVCVPNGGNGNPEACDGLDNNCNGQVDEGNPGGGATCDTGVPGACGPGTITCQAGALSCVANAAQGPELCDSPGDENCNGTSAQVFFKETFASNAAGWQLDQEWQIGSATASSGQNFGNPDPSMDHTATNDNGVAGVVIGGNAATQPQHPMRWLTSPVIPVDPNATKVYLQLWRFLNSDYAPWMTNRIEVYDAASQVWATVWQSGMNPGVSDSKWTKLSYDITSHAKGGSVRVRFGFSIGANGAFIVSQWNVDDVAITTEPCD